MPIAPDKLVDLKGPDGKLVSVPAGEARRAIQEGGYALPSEAELHEDDLQQTYGEGLGNTAKATALGVARGVTGPLADLALTKTGIVNPETIREIRDRNPVASTAGEVAGLVGGTLLAPEATLPGVLSKVGRGAEVAASKVLAGKLASKAVGSAVEGAAYGLNQVVDEAVLGDPDLTAQSAIAQVGLGALVGGGVPVVGSVLGKGASKGLDAAKAAFNKLAGEAEGEAGALVKGYAKASSMVSGKPEESIIQAWKDRAITAQTKTEQAAVQKEFASSLDDQYKTLEKALSETHAKVREVETDLLLQGSKVDEVVPRLKPLATEVEGTLKSLRADPELYPPFYARKLEVAYEGLTKDLNTVSDSAGVFKAFDKFKGILDKSIPYGKDLTAENKEAVSLFQKLRFGVRSALEDEGTFGKAAARQAAFNNASSDHQLAVKAFRKMFMREVPKKGAGKAYTVDAVKVNTFFNQVTDARGASKSDVISGFLKSSRKVIQEMEASNATLPQSQFDSKGLQSLLKKNEESIAKGVQEAEAIANFKAIGGQSDRLVGTEGGTLAGAMLGGVPGALAGATAGALRTPSLTITRLAALERAIQRTNDRIKGALSGVVEGRSAKAVVKVAEATPMKERVEHIQTLANDPGILVAELTDRTADIADAAPSTSMSTKATAAAAVAFLASKIPQRPPEDPFTPEYAYSPSEVAKFERYYSAVQKPLSILDDMERGTLTPEGVEAVATVYPALYNKMGQEAFAALAGTKGKKVPYKGQLMLSMLLGQNLGPGMNPQAITMNQKGFLPTPPSDAMNSAKPRKPTDLTLSSRTQSPLDALTNRK